MSEIRLPEALRERVESDLAPVKALNPVWRQALNVLAVSAVVFAAAVFALGLRSDLVHIPSWLGWGCSILEFSLAALLIGLALRESIPGRGVPLPNAMAALSAAVVYQLSIGYITWRFSPGVPWNEHCLAHGVGCMGNETLLALPTFVATLWLIFRAYPVRAWMAGLLGGAGAAIASDAVTHLRCPISDLRHVLVWHTGAVILFAGLGALVGHFWSRGKRTNH